ncbi:MAG: DUF1287 domain-containing protein [Gammaproteobacteria bacterium]
MNQPFLRLYCPLLLLQAIVAGICLADSQTPLEHSQRQDYGLQLANAALARTYVFVVYDSAYRALDYPGGDVANNRGVCSDVVIRAYRALGIDLQKRVHEDMSESFDDYPNRWGLKRPDANIDHRRVPNLERFFTRMGAALPAGAKADYQPGDIVSWRLPNGRPHIGVVQSSRSSDGKRPLVVHNIGFGPELEDKLFHYRITGHFRYSD